jgi:hypothetical protein
MKKYLSAFAMLGSLAACVQLLAGVSASYAQLPYPNPEPAKQMPGGWVTRDLKILCTATKTGVSSRTGATEFLFADWPMVSFAVTVHDDRAAGNPPVELKVDGNPWSGAASGWPAESWSAVLPMTTPQEATAIEKLRGQMVNSRQLTMTVAGTRFDLDMTGYPAVAQEMATCERNAFKLLFLRGAAGK